MLILKDEAHRIIRVIRARSKTFQVFLARLLSSVTWQKKHYFVINNRKREYYRTVELL